VESIEPHRDDARDELRESAPSGVGAAMLGVALVGHLMAYAAWFDDIGHLAGLFAFPAGMIATVLYGTYGAAASVAWAVFANLMLGSFLVSPSGAREGIAATFLAAPFLIGHGVLAVALFTAGRLRDLKRKVDEQSRELVALYTKMREADKSGQQERLGQRLSRADRMASVGALAHGVAHEINNPLTYVIGNLYYAVEELDRDEGQGSKLREELSELLRDALDGAERVRRIVRDLERFSRGGDEDAEQRVDVRATIEMAVNLVRNEIRHRARLTLELNDVPIVRGSESRLVQAFVNLLMNACQAIPEGNAALESVSVRTLSDGRGSVWVQIHDSGVGMPPEVRARIFDPFFTTKPVGVGTGLGLSVTSGIISSMNGEIRVESAPQQGSTFTVVLPVYDGAQVRVDERRSVVPRARLRVLVVDDEPKVGVSMKRMLRGDEVEVLDDAREALALLKRDRSFDAVLCDLMMPDVTGMDLYAEVRAIDPAFARRFVFMTGGAFTPRARAFVADVPNITLEKPFDSERVRSAITTTLKESKGLD
jgi:signal transduction histidine kinase